MQGIQASDRAVAELERAGAQLSVPALQANRGSTDTSTATRIGRWHISWGRSGRWVLSCGQGRPAAWSPTESTAIFTNCYQELLPFLRILSFSI